jgi:hypothetical protein
MIYLVNCSYIIIIIIIIIINVTYILHIEKFSTVLPHAGNGNVTQMIYIIVCSMLFGRKVTNI